MFLECLQQCMNCFHKLSHAHTSRGANFQFGIGVHCAVGCVEKHFFPRINLKTPRELSLAMDY